MTAIRLRLSEPDRQLLVGGAAALGVDLDPASVTDLARFADLLDLWCPRVNLVSCGSARELIERHFLDSLAVAPLVADQGTIVDLGTGAGFPGIPLAIARRRQKVVLVEARRKRVSFLLETKRTLGLANVEILEQRAEEPPEAHAHRATSVVSRAVWSDTAAMTIASGWLEAEGHLLCMRSDPFPGGSVPRSFTHARTVSYRIGRDRPRVVEILRHHSPGSQCST